MLHLPLEILGLIFESLVHDVQRRFRTAKTDVQNVYGLLLVSATVRALVEPMLYRKILRPSNRRLRVLCCTMIKRPEVAAMVKEAHLEEGEPDWRDDFGAGEDEEDLLDEELNSLDSSDSSQSSNEDENEVSLDEDQDLLVDLDFESLDAAAELVKSRFQTNGERIRARLEPDCLDRIEISNAHAMKWALLLQLTNLTTLTLKARSSEFASMAMLLHLPNLEELNFSIDIPRGSYWDEEFVPADEILESIISSTNRLKSLQWDDISGSSAFPVRHDAPKLKQILERHAAPTLEYLSVQCGMEDELGIRSEHHCVEIQECLGSMQNFTELKVLSVQWEVLLGRPGEGPRLKDVLPPQLEKLYCDTKTDYYGCGITDRVWNDDECLAEFEDLALAEPDDPRLASLNSVGLCMATRCNFTGSGAPNFDIGILGKSRIKFGWL